MVCLGSCLRGEYNREVVNSKGSDRNRYLPDADRLSVLAAVILLAYTLTRFVTFPTWEPALQLPGVYLSIKINFQTVVALLVAGLTAAGADWLFHDHPALQGRSAAPHWLLPALTALVIGLPLSQIPFGLYWWVGLLAGGTLLILVLVAEYISINRDDLRQPIASAGLTAVSFAIYLILAASLRTAGARLFLVLPALFIGAGLVSLRAMHLRLHGQWVVYESGIIALIVSQLAAALHYWPLGPVTFGLLLIGPTYALNSLFVSLIEERPMRDIILEPLLAIVISTGVAIWIH